MGKVASSSIRARLLISAVHLLALATLVSVLLAAIVSQKISPFHSFIRGTPLEQWGSYIVGVVTRQDLFWRQFLARLPLLKDEQQAHDLLIERIQAYRPSHALVWRDGRSAFGTLRQRGPNTFRFDFETATGPVSLPVDRSEIAWSRRIVYEPVSLTPQDVRFLLEFPQLKCYHLPPYLFVADVPFGQVMAARDILGNLADEFFAVFAHLLPRWQPGKLAYACLYRDEPSYLAQAIQRKDAHLEKSTGFYSQQENCLYLYDPLGSFERHRAERLMKALPDGPDLAFNQQRLYNFLQLEQFRTLRHEGAHQLAYSYGLHSSEGVEHLWLVEGLAQYCETSPIGQLQPQHMATLVEALQQGRLIPWLELVNTHTTADLENYEAEVAYAQSWLLFHTLMQPAFRPRLNQYIRNLQAISPGDLGKARSELLDAHLGIPLIEVARQMNDQLTAFKRRANGPATLDNTGKSAPADKP